MILRVCNITDHWFVGAQVGSIVEEEEAELMQAVTSIVERATEQGNMSEERAKHFLHSGKKFALISRWGTIPNIIKY
jgi:hypothetical protein